jgi:hypothetical protein
VPTPEYFVAMIQTVLVQVSADVDTDDTNKTASVAAERQEFGAPCFAELPKSAIIILVFGYMCFIRAHAAV